MCHESIRVCIDLEDLSEYARRWMYLEAQSKIRYEKPLNGMALTLSDVMRALDEFFLGRPYEGEST